MGINERYPKIVMHLVDPGNILQRINRGSFQIAVLPIVPQHQIALEHYLKRYHWRMETLYDDTFKVLVSTQNPLSRKSSVSLADLNGTRIKLYNNFPYGDSFDILRPTTSMEYDNGIKIITAVSDNKAVGIFPPSRDSLVQAYADAGLFRILPFYDMHFPMRYCLIYWERLQFMTAGRVVIDEMKRSYIERT
jgi:DNA-binding transcriptional LysR family regulator